MSRSQTHRAAVAAFSVCALLAFTSFGSKVTAENRANEPRRVASIIRIAPAPPLFDEKERLSELAQRRARVARAIGPSSLLILFSTEPRVYTNDVDYQYRQENNLYYLTNLKQKGATLVLLPGNTQFSEILFLPRRNPAAETWTGHMYSPQEANEISGIREIWEVSEFEPFIKALRNRQPYRPNAEKILMSELPSSMRLRKSPMELRIMQHAIDISTEAHERAWAAAANAKWEYEVDAEVAYTFKLRNADNWGYPDIVGCGANATTLHYQESQGPVKMGNLMLMDVGAEYGHYSADVTRTFPVNGKFTKEQAEIYQIVYDAQEAAAKAIHPGATLSQVHNAAKAVIKDGLLRLGLITDVNSESQYRTWFMHGTSHWLGMNVHDVGGGAT